jgi:PAS domain S-box-containing protein
LLDRLIQNYSSWLSVVEVSILGPGGVVLAHSHRKDGNSFNSHRQKTILYRDLEPTLAPLFEQASASGLPLAQTTRLGDQWVVVYVLPFSDSLFPRLGIEPSMKTNRRGAAIAVMDRQELIKSTQTTTLMAIGLLVGAGSLTLILMTLLIQRLVLRPLTSLHQSLLQKESLASFTPPPLPQNEIGFLGETLTHTFEQLKRYQDQALQLAEQKYVEIAQRYELASQATRVWIWEWQPGSDMVAVDVSLLTWLGFAPESAADSFVQCRDFFIFDGDRPQFWQMLNQGQNDALSEFTCECRLQSSEGQLFWCLLRGQLYPEQLEKTQRIIGTVTDITERKQAEDQLQESNRILARATRLKDEFLANMSHELRTPLNAILGMTEALQEEVYGNINPKQQQCLETVANSGNHLLSLINDILDLSKIEAGKIELTLIPVNVDSLCSTSLAFIRQFAQQKNIALQCEFPPILPTLDVDERRIRQVLINLLNNAVKFTPEGGTVTLSVALDSNLTQQNSLPQLQITVQDTGIGIAPENLDKLFQPFVQIDSALNRRYDGTGLGLALVKKIVELHGGTVGVTSQLNIGSCFFITLPYGADTIVSAPGSPPPSLGCLPHILLAQANEAHAQTLVNYLQAKGYGLERVLDLPTAIATAKANPPDVMLLDFDLLPPGEGMNVNYLRQSLGKSPIPLIALVNAEPMQGTPSAWTADVDE